MSILSSNVTYAPSRRLRDAEGVATTFYSPNDVTSNSIQGAMVGTVGGSIPFLVAVAAQTIGDGAEWLGASGVASVLESASQGLAATGIAIMAASLIAASAYAVDVMTIRKTAAALGESELRRMSGVDPFLNFASVMKDGQWLVKDAGADAVPQVMSRDDYIAWREKVDASDIPLVVFTVGNVQKDVLSANRYSYDESKSYYESDVLTARKLVNGRAAGFSDEDPFMRIYWASEKAMKAYGFTEVAKENDTGKLNAFDNAFYETGSPMKPELRTNYDSMPGQGILAGNRDTPYDYGVSHGIRERASEIVEKFADGLIRKFGPNRDPAADASVSLDEVAASGPRR